MREAFDGAPSSGAECAWLCGHTVGLTSSSAAPVFSGMVGPWEWPIPESSCLLRTGVARRVARRSVRISTLQSSRVGRGEGEGGAGRGALRARGLNQRSMRACSEAWRFRASVA